MKRIIGLTFAIFAIGIIFSMDSYAQGKRRPAGINQRQQNQKQRIVNGVRSRELTGRETYRLIRTESDPANGKPLPAVGRWSQPT